MLQSWRWFGPNDPVSLREIRQAGATEIVTSLHHLECGAYWSQEEISKRVRAVAWDERTHRPSGLRWSVVESLPIHEDIKTRTGDYAHYIDIYQQNVRNLGAQGVRTVCYNFIPVLDWARTDLNVEQADGSTISACNIDAFVAFDLFVLQRPAAQHEYAPWEIASAKAFYEGLTPHARDELTRCILLGLPGTVDDLTPANFLQRLERYQGIDDAQLRDNLYRFLNAIMPTCEEAGVKMCIHPDDPAYSVFGVPRILSRSADVEQLFREVPSIHSGLTLCTGSFGSCIDNNPAQMLEQFADRVYFVHFRNVSHVPGKTGSFYESNHLFGSVDMPRAMKALVQEEERRKAVGMVDAGIPVRPDHGKLMDGDKSSGAYPGYSRTGRMIGLAELRGLEHGIRYALGLDVAA
jgi:mannonate dehydratase